MNPIKKERIWGGRSGTEWRPVRERTSHGDGYEGVVGRPLGHPLPFKVLDWG